MARWNLWVAVSVLTVLALLCTGTAVADTTQASPHAQSISTNETQPPSDPATDRLGWENGYWYNESLSVDRSDGLNQTELDAVVNRSMARVEQVRRVEFERSVPVEIIAREEFSVGGSGSPPTWYERQLNTKWEAALMINESTSAYAVTTSSREASVGGYYSPSRDRIVIISENITSPKMDEITLSQELFHALQDQQFGTSEFDQSTRELHNAKDGIVEGDGNLVDRLYEARCDAEWDCLRPRPSNGSSGGSADIHFGVYLTQYQPYSDGPKFVKQIRESGGWDAVDAVYENPPQSTEQVIHPEKYRNDEPVVPEIETTPSDGWARLSDDTFANERLSFGEAGLVAMLFYPYYDSNGASTPVISPFSFFNYTESGQLSSFDPLNYSTVPTAGWDGDTLVPFVNRSATGTDAEGYVWKFAWDSETDATQFRTAYEQLLQYRGAMQNGEHTWRIPEDRGFADAFWVEQTNDTVVVVNAPTPSSLPEIYSGIANSREVPAVPGATGPPTNLDDDLPLEDVDGDGEGTVFDALTYYNNRNSDVVQNNPNQFDFDGDGEPGTVFDALALYNELTS